MSRNILVSVVLYLQDRAVSFAARLMFGSALPPDSGCILVYRTARLGDFIVALPALSALRKAYPRMKIVLMTGSSSRHESAAATVRQIGDTYYPWIRFAYPSLVDEVCQIDLSRPSRALTEARRCVQAHSPAAVFILPYSGEGGWNRLKKLVFLRLAGFSGTLYGVRIHSSLGILRLPQFETGRIAHEVWGPLRAVMECPAVPRINGADIDFPITLEAGPSSAISELLQELGWETERLAVILPGGSFPHKRWPLEKFILLGRMLSESGIKILIIGSTDESKLCASLSEALGRGRAADLSARLDIVEVAALLRKAGLFIGNDSGPAHLAAAMGCSGIVFFSGIVFPGLWEPWGGRMRSLREEVVCQYCFADVDCPTGTRECIEKISVERAFRELQEVLVAQRYESARRYAKS